MPTKERSAALKKRAAKAERLARLEIHWKNQSEKEAIARALNGALRVILEELQPPDFESYDGSLASLVEERDAMLYRRVMDALSDRNFWERKALPKADVGVPIFLAAIERMLTPVWPEFKQYKRQERA